MGSASQGVKGSGAGSRGVMSEFGGLRVAYLLEEGHEGVKLAEAIQDRGGSAIVEDVEEMRREAAPAEAAQEG
jgi:hypothetical protein